MSKPMEKKNAFLSQSLTYGLYFGLVLIALSLVLWMLNVIPGKISTGILLFLVNIAIYAGLLYYATRRYRDDSLGGFISYGKALSFALMVVVVASVINAVYSYIFNTLIDPGYLERISKITMENTESWMRERGLSQEQIDQAMARVESRGVANAMKSSFQALIGGTITGFIIALITSAFAKKTEEVFEG